MRETIEEIGRRNGKRRKEGDGRKERKEEGEEEREKKNNIIVERGEALRKVFLEERKRMKEKVEMMEREEEKEEKESLYLSLENMEKVLREQEEKFSLLEEEKTT